MDYKEKYEKALERAKYALTTDMDNSGHWAVKHIFPELAESEDEKIMKEIIRYLKETVGDEDIISPWIAWLEKQGGKKPQGKTALEAIKEEKVDNANKIEPKFKIGDYIVNDYCAGKVVALTDDAYLLDTGQGIPFSCEHNAHLWTIQDAKDGDVLVCESGERTLECLFIFKLIADREVHEYCSYRTIDKHFSLKDSFLGYVDNVYHPATQEQRNLLFTMIKEAGWKWDAEKKELKNTVDEFEEDWDSIKTLKFKGGDIVVNGSGSILEIVERNSYGYFYKVISNSEKVDAILFSNRSEMEDTFHLWTISDAKKGDVLEFEDHERVVVGIVSFVNERTGKVDVSCLLEDNEFKIGTFFALDTIKPHPATKEQRDILFTKMKEEGYQWDAEKKKLNKINSYCQENCKGYQETGKCFTDGGCDAKRKAEQESAEWSEEDEGMKENIEGALDCYESMVSENWEKEKEWLKSLKDRIGG